METKFSSKRKMYKVLSTYIVWSETQCGNINLALHKPTKNVWPVCIKRWRYKAENNLTKRIAAEKVYRDTIEWIDKNAT